MAKEEKRVEIVYVSMEKIKPYKNNPRNNKKAIDKVAMSIEKYGFKVPCVLDEKLVIITGHTRYYAAQKLGYKKIPCIIASDLSKEKIKEFRIADNKVSEYSEWDFDLLAQELDELDLGDFDFDFGAELNEDIDWDDVPDLSEATYKPPEVNNLRCPHCGHIDSKAHFVKVNVQVAHVDVEDFKIRRAKEFEVEQLRQIADSGVIQSGFISKAAIEEAVENKKIIVAVKGKTILGFCYYNVRKRDGNVVIYEICVDNKYRNNGIEAAFIERLPLPVMAKCTVEHSLNKLYKKSGFKLVDTVEGKKRTLNVWVKER